MKLMVIDGNSIVSRAFYGIRLLTASDGTYTNAVYGFLTILLKLLDEEKPEALCVAFDLKAPTFRHDQYEGYKAGRKPMPDELAMQLPILKEVLDAMNIPRFELSGYEADDIIGTVSRRCEADGWECVIVTGDKDSLQLIGGGVRVKLVSTKNGQTLTRDYTSESFFEEYGFSPPKMVDLKGLMGDASDNIPGVTGIGEKTALDMVRKYGTIEEIYQGLDALELKPSMLGKLREGHEQALMSHRLATIETNVPIEFKPEDALRLEFNSDALYKIFLRLEFSKLIDRFGLRSVQHTPELFAASRTVITVETRQELDAMASALSAGAPVSVYASDDLSLITVETQAEIFHIFEATLGELYAVAVNLIFSPSLPKLGHGVKGLITRLLDAGLPHDGWIFDTELAAYLLSPAEGGYSLERLSVAYLNLELPKFDTGGSQGFLSAPPDLAAYASRCSAIRGLYDILMPKLRELDMLRLFNEIELPLCRVLAHMEHLGFAVDRRELERFSGILSLRIDELTKQIYTLAGEDFNINSTKKLGEILFDKLGLPHIKKTKTGYSTDAEVLEKLRGKHEIIGGLLEYRQLTKLKSTYADGLLKVISSDGRIHTSFNMTATATGRLSSTEPNLQNIPVRQELGSELRRMFIAADGFVLVDADYSQIELRVLAHIADDKKMQAAFSSGEDIHRVTASQVFDIPPEEVTPLMRRYAKAVNFGIVYGISDYSLSQDINTTRAEARLYMDNYLEKYSGVRAYMKDVVVKAKQDGFVTTLWGRRRYLPELGSSNFNIRSGAERIALNTPIQGTAADIIKLAMVRVFNRVEAEGLKSRLVLQVHDELIVEAPEDEQEYIKKLLTEEMEGAMSLSIPLEAEAKSGRTWYDAK